MSDTVPLAGDWNLWRDFAVRSAGFPVAGLDAFGPGDESERLADVANDARFQEAVTWQNPAALANAVLKVASRAPTKPPSRARGREEIVASYWQRYCGKNDTIGFFGPLAWGRIEDEGPPLHARSGDLVRESHVHFESWGVQALAEALDPELRIARGPHPERDLRAALDAHSDPDTRRRGTAALDRLEAARAAVADASPSDLREALAQLDAVFTDLTEQDAVRNPGMAYGARTLSYIDCMRDLDVTVGPGLVAAMAPALQALFEACRWWSGQVDAMCRRVVEGLLPDGGRGPFMPVFARALGTLMQHPPGLDDELAELHRRLQAVLADPDRATIGVRAAAAFADHQPSWRHGVFSSADIQVAARDENAVAGGDFLAVVGDVHPGNNPLIQGVFAHRHPAPARMHQELQRVIGPGLPVILPPWSPTMGADGRGMPATSDDMVHIAVMPETRAQGGRHTWMAQELLVDGTDLVDPTGELRVSLFDALWLPFFVSGVRRFSLLPEEERSPRVTFGRMVLRREGWSIPATEIPERADDVAAFARDRGMPRRVFMKSPLERKPMYLDTESPTLARILCRQARHAREQPGTRMEFTEMLPGPDECWLADADGNHYVSELRMVAVDASAG
ncbi:MAG TPA: lantibiotic dehydratase [Gaiellales bacterium]|nr:lantibiotic dehydratase [Gaiellales bacterium]